MVGGFGRVVGLRRTGVTNIGGLSRSTTLSSYISRHSYHQGVFRRGLFITGTAGTMKLIAPGARSICLSIAASSDVVGVPNINSSFSRLRHQSLAAVDDVQGFLSKRESDHVGHGQDQTDSIGVWSQPDAQAQSDGAPDHERSVAHVVAQPGRRSLEQPAHRFQIRLMQDQGCPDRGCTCVHTTECPHESMSRREQHGVRHTDQTQDSLQVHPVFDQPSYHLFGEH